MTVAMVRRLAFLAAACLALGGASAEAPATVDDARLAAALATVQPQRAGTVEAFVIAASLDSDPVFNREAREAGRVLADRFDAKNRTVVLAEDEGRDLADGKGTPPHLALALAGVAALMDRQEDVLILYSTGHGSPRAGLNYKIGSYGEGVITPKQLADMLAATGIQNRLIILQACYSGQFVAALATRRTVVATAASSLTPSFGCSAGNDWTFFGHALINQAMRKADSFVRQFRRAVVAIIGWEGKLGIPPSNPQLKVGEQAGGWLSVLDAGARPVPPGPVGRPPSELGN